MSEQPPQAPSWRPEQAWQATSALPVHSGSSGANEEPKGQAPPRKQHTVLNVLLIALGVAVLVVVGLVVVTNYIINSSGPVAGEITPPPATASAVPLTSITKRTGSAIDLTGGSPGEKVDVTVLRVFSHPRGAATFAGDRLYAVRLRLRNTGSVAYSDAPSDDAQVVDAAGQPYPASTNTVTACPVLPNIENIPVGHSGLGCIVFEVPANARITLVQFTLDSGTGPQTGQWRVSR